MKKNVKNMYNNKRFVVGDIHGELDKLIRVLTLSNFSKDDLLISLGDLSDRGENSWDVVEYLMKLDNLVFIKGNHDFHMRNWLYNGNYTLNWFKNGGNSTIDSYHKNKMKNKEKHLSFYDSSIPYFILDNKCFVHGGLNLNFLISEHSEESLCRDRTLSELQIESQTFLKSKDGFDEIYIGHTPTTEYGSKIPIIKNGIINMDTGCGKGGLLSIMNIDTKEYFQA